MLYFYSFWADGKELWMARSLEQGKSWETWKVAAGRENAYYPYLIARGRGELAVTWFSGEGDRFRAHVARLEAGRGEPKIVEAAPFVPDSWRANSNDSPVHDPAGEYLPVLFLKAGGLAASESDTEHGRKARGFLLVALRGSVTRFPRARVAVGSPRGRGIRSYCRICRL